MYLCSPALYPRERFTVLLINLIIIVISQNSSNNKSYLLELNPATNHKVSVTKEIVNHRSYARTVTAEHNEQIVVWHIL